MEYTLTKPVAGINKSKKYTEIACVRAHTHTQKKLGVAPHLPHPRQLGLGGSNREIAGELLQGSRNEPRVCGSGIPGLLGNRKCTLANLKLDHFLSPSVPSP